MLDTQKAFTAIDNSISKTKAELKKDEISLVESMAAGTAVVNGLENAQMEELLIFPHNIQGIVQTLSKDSVGVVFLDNADSIRAGDRVKRSGRVVDVPVGTALLGRTINPLGAPLDGKGPLGTTSRRPIEVEARAIMDRAPVDMPLQTGIKAIDAFTPIGRGQRELILGDRQTGKTAIATDMMLNQKDSGIICIYCAIGQRNAAVAQVIADLEKNGVLEQSVIVVAAGDDTAGMQYIAPYAATSIGEYFMEQGRDVLIIYDDLTNHARAYRQMSLLLRRPPGREAYPGDVFYIHSRLLERSTHLRAEFGGGSLTAIPIVATEAGNISAYIPTNIISITDGQIYLATPLFQKGIMPAIDTGRSVSRVGGDAQLPAYKQLVGPLKLFYSQFEELEAFTKFGTQLDETTKTRIKRGLAIRSVLTQRRYKTMTASDQIAVFMATNAGLFDDLDDKQNKQAQKIILDIWHAGFADVISAIYAREKISEAQKEDILTAFKQALEHEGLMQNDS